MGKMKFVALSLIALAGVVTARVGGEHDHDHDHDHHGHGHDHHGHDHHGHGHGHDEEHPPEYRYEVKSENDSHKLEIWQRVGAADIPRETMAAHDDVQQKCA